LGKFLLDPRKFRYEHIIPNTDPRLAFEVIRHWLNEEGVTKLESMGITVLKAKHGRKKMAWGWEPDSPKWLEFTITAEGPDTKVEVWAHPTRSMQYGAFQDPQAAQRGYAEALERVWRRFGMASEIPAHSLEGRPWPEVFEQGRREILQGVLVLVAISSIFGILLAINVVTGTPAIGPEWGRPLGSGLALVGMAGALLIVTGRSKKRMARREMKRLGATNVEK
jgi:hypothetical protein